MSNLLQRALTGAAFVAVLLGSVIIGQYTFILLFLLIIVLGLWEFYSLSAKDQAEPQKVYGTVLGGTMFLLVCFGLNGTISFSNIFLIFPLSFLVFFFELFRAKQRPFLNIAYTLLGMIYIALPFSFLASLAFSKVTYNYEILLGFFLILWSSDTGAYLAGVKFGKHRLFERISPKKSWEGSAGGTLMALVAAHFISRQFTSIDRIDWLIITLIIVVSGTLGDLTESMFKRSIEVKDSGSILPGHGGILDRFDALFLAAPFVYFYLTYFNRIF